MHPIIPLIMIIFLVFICGCMDNHPELRNSSQVLIEKGKNLTGYGLATGEEEIQKDWPDVRSALVREYDEMKGDIADVKTEIIRSVKDDTGVSLEKITENKTLGGVVDKMVALEGEDLARGSERAGEKIRDIIRDHLSRPERAAFPHKDMADAGRIIERLT